MTPLFVDWEVGNLQTNQKIIICHKTPIFQYFAPFKAFCFIIIKSNYHTFGNQVII